MTTDVTQDGRKCNITLPLNLWEHQNAIKTTYARCVEKTCEIHGITRMELDILLFLANNPCFDTATDIVENRYLAKSHVSSSVKLLETRGYLRRQYTQGNRKTAHLKITDAAAKIVRDGQAAQRQFVSIVMKGFTSEEINSMRAYNERIFENINAYLKEENQPCTNF